MKVLIFLAPLLATISAGIISHDVGHEHEKATSYQNIHMEHFYAVPTYIKKEDLKYLHHPIPKGKTISKVEIHHGDKHDPGYAIASNGEEEGHQFHGGAHGGFEGYQQVKAQENLNLHQQHDYINQEQDIGYQVEDQSQGHDYQKYQLGQVESNQGQDEDQVNLQFAHLGHQSVNLADLIQQYKHLGQGYQAAAAETAGSGLGSYKTAHLPSYDGQDE